MEKNEHLDEYFRTNYKKLIQFARRRVGNYSLASAEDAVQEAFTRACKYYRTYNRSEVFDAWFKSILSNCVNQIKRDERNMGVVTDDEVEDIGGPPHVIVFSKEVESAFKALTTRDQHIINNYFFYDLKSREISELLNVSHDVVRDVIRRFRVRVRV